MVTLTTCCLTHSLFPSWRILIEYIRHNTDVTSWSITKQTLTLVFTDKGVPGKNHSLPALILKACKACDLIQTEAMMKKSHIPSCLSGKLRSVKKFHVFLCGPKGPWSLTHHTADLSWEWEILIREMGQPWPNKDGSDNKRQDPRQPAMDTSQSNTKALPDNTQTTETVLVGGHPAG